MSSTSAVEINIHAVSAWFISSPRSTSCGRTGREPQVIERAGRHPGRRDLPGPFSTQRFLWGVRYQNRRQPRLGGFGQTKAGFAATKRREADKGRGGGEP